MAFHEKTTIYLLNFKIGVLVFLFISGFFVATNTDSDPSLTVIRSNSGEVYSTSKEEVERRREEVDAKLKQFESERNNGLLGTPFIVPKK